MTNILPNNTYNSHSQSTEEAAELIRRLRQKEGSWVEWGQACAYLQKNGYNPQAIFESTGFEPIQQNQVIVGSQVYASIKKVGVSEATSLHYFQKGSDVLYELRLLNHEERAAAADLTFQHQVDCEEAREVARAIKDFSRFHNPPAGFSRHPGDAVAYHCWKLAKQNSDLKVRSRLIAKGLKFLHTLETRQKLEQLLTDLTVDPKRTAPTLPFYRLNADAEIPRIVPVVGKLPLTLQDINKITRAKEIKPFNIIKLSGEQAWVALPGWQVVLSAEDPIVILCNSDHFLAQTQTCPEKVMVIVDCAQRKWEAGSYFMVENNGELDFQWFADIPDFDLFGRVLVIMRPKKIFDELLSLDSWQLDE